MLQFIGVRDRKADSWDGQHYKYSRHLSNVVYNRHLSKDSFCLADEILGMLNVNRAHGLKRFS